MFAITGGPSGTDLMLTASTSVFILKVQMPLFFFLLFSTQLFWKIRAGLPSPVATIGQTNAKAANMSGSKM